MLLFNNTIENAVLEELSKGSVSSPLLVQRISSRETVSFQGVYKAITSLIQRDIVTKTKMTLSLNMLWFERLNSFTESVSKNYVHNEFNDFLFLDHKEKVTYNFFDAKKLDTQWLHFTLVIAKKFSDEPIFIWNPHHWFIFAREQEESMLFNWLNNTQRKTYLLIGNNLDLDLQAKKSLQSAWVKVNLDSESKLPRNGYNVVIGDYIMTTIYPPEFTEEVERIFKGYKEGVDSTSNYLRQLIHKPISGKIIMERNKKKALKLSQQISKDFFLEESVRNYLKNGR